MARHIAKDARGKHVNIIAHSMGGLDARYMVSHLQPRDVTVHSLVTVASPHHGSAFAEYVFDQIGAERLPSIYKFVEGIGLETGAFQQLTRHYMAEQFNPRTPDDPDIRYFSYGAMMDEPPLLSPFRQSHKVIADAEGPNDGLVSVKSSLWGNYKGTLMGTNHLDLINVSSLTTARAPSSGLIRHFIVDQPLAMDHAEDDGHPSHQSHVSNYYAVF